MEVGESEGAKSARQRFTLMQCGKQMPHLDAHEHVRRKSREALRALVLILALDGGARELDHLAGDRRGERSKLEGEGMK